MPRGGSSLPNSAQDLALARRPCRTDTGLDCSLKLPSYAHLGISLHTWEFELASKATCRLQVQFHLKQRPIGFPYAAYKTALPGQITNFLVHFPNSGQPDVPDRFTAGQPTKAAALTCFVQHLKFSHLLPQFWSRILGTLSRSSSVGPLNLWFVKNENSLMLLIMFLGAH